MLVADSLEDDARILKRSSPEIIILSLTYPGLSEYDDGFFLQKIDDETPIIGILPDKLTSSNMEKLINLSETLEEVAVRPSEDHNKKVSAVIRHIAPHG